MEALHAKFVGNTPTMPVASPGISTLAYRPLLGRDDIRLFILSPGYKCAPLRGLLFHTSLKVAQNYRALSYVWGNTIHRSGLLTPDGHLSVTSNLYMVLQQLRDTQESTILWIDAICINQKDNEEKAGQIRLMSQIYQSATSVVAYLGRETPVNDIAMQTLMLIKTKEGPKEWPKHLPPVPTSWADKSIPPPDDESWRCIGKFFGLR
jgi:Heterokaryon incompatibility protein (HET)